jgi:Lipopolysaccharide-assembly
VKRLRRSFAAAALIACACGYSLGAGSRRLPPTAQRVFVRPLENRTTDAEVGALVAAALRDELARRSADGGADAAARIEGTVEDASFAAVGLNPPNYHLTLTVSARLVVKGNVLAEQRFSRGEDYLSGLDPLESEGRRRLALRRAAEAVAQQIVETFEEP